MCIHSILNINARDSSENLVSFCQTTSMWGHIQAEILSRLICVAVTSWLVNRQSSRLAFGMPSAKSRRVICHVYRYFSCFSSFTTRKYQNIASIIPLNFLKTYPSPHAPIILHVRQIIIYIIVCCCINHSVIDRFWSIHSGHHQIYLSYKKVLEDIVITRNKISLYMKD